MLTIMYKVGIYSYNLNTSLLSQTIIGGMVATYTDNREVGLCSPDTVPVGFFMNDTNSASPYETPTFPGGRANIAVGGELQTDVFEPGTYQINDFLYCSHNGKISNDPQYRGNIIIGIVNLIEPNIADPRLIGFLTCFTRGLDISAGIVPIKKMTRFQILKNTCNTVMP